jgi:hypothetical protein
LRIQELWGNWIRNFEPKFDGTAPYRKPEQYSHQFFSRISLGRYFAQKQDKLEQRIALESLINLHTTSKLGQLEAKYKISPHSFTTAHEYLKVPFNPNPKKCLNQRKSYDKVIQEYSILIKQNPKSFSEAQRNLLNEQNYYAIYKVQTLPFGISKI